MKLEYLNEYAASGIYTRSVAAVNSVIHEGEQQTEHLMNDFRVLGYVDASLQAQYMWNLVEGSSSGSQQD